MSKYTAAKRAAQKKIGDKPVRQYKLTDKQAAKAEKAYTKGISLAKLRKIVGASKQSVSQWMRGRGVVRKHPIGLSTFQADVQSMMRMRNLSYSGKYGAVRETMYEKYWYEKRMVKWEKALKYYDDRFQAGKSESKKQRKRRHWLQGKIQSERLLDHYTRNRRRPDPEELKALLDMDVLGNYEEWEG